MKGLRCSEGPGCPGEIERQLNDLERDEAIFAVGEVVVADCLLAVANELSWCELPIYLM